METIYLPRYNADARVKFEVEEIGRGGYLQVQPRSRNATGISKWLPRPDSDRQRYFVNAEPFLAGAWTSRIDGLTPDQTVRPTHEVVALYGVV